MFIDDLGKTTFIDNNINNMLKTDITSDKFKKCIIDGELIRKFTEDGELHSINFYAFDVLMFDGFDIRDDSRYLFKQRFDKLRSIISSCSCPGNIHVQVKKFIYRNVFMGSEIIMKDVANKPYENDGLIFTPMNEPYPKTKKWSKLLKWKPADQNTIDFYAVKTIDKQTNQRIWELYVQGPSDSNSGNKTQTTKVLFDIRQLCPDLPSQSEITFKTIIDDSILDPTTKESYQTNTVIEFKWDSLKKLFVPIRTRWDKSSNPKKHGNFSKVACSIWNNIHNPISEETLFNQMTNNSTPQVGGGSNFFFDRMNMFHNKIKKYLVNKYIKGTTLEISAGRSDLSYYTDFKDILHSFEFESLNSKTNVREMCKNVKSLSLAEYDFIQIPFNDILSNKTIYDNVFSSDINLFFSSQDNLNLLSTFLTYRLSKTGKFIVIFIDADNLRDGANFHDSEIMYNVKSNKHSVSLYLNGLTFENEPIIVSRKLTASFLKSEMDKNGFDCLESANFSDLYDHAVFQMKQYEKDISLSMSYCVFGHREDKNKDKDNQQYKIISNVMKNTKIFHSEEPLPIILDVDRITKMNNVSLYRINSLLDLTDILNCEKFKHKRPLPTPEINYDIIKCYLKNTNIEFTELSNLGNTFENISVVLYKHTYRTESQDNSEENEIVFVVLYKNKILYNISDIRKEMQTLHNSNENVIIEAEESKHKKTKNEVQNILNNKTTMNILKEKLRNLNLKTSGSKQDLIMRLEEWLKT